MPKFPFPPKQGDLSRWNGTGWEPYTLTSADVSTLLGTMAVQNANAVAISGGSVTGITDLAIADGGTGASSAAAARTALGSTTVGDAVFIATDAAAARTAIGAGTMSTQAANSVAITGGTISGITALTMADASNVAVNTATGTKIGTATAQKLGFWNATPIIQPAGATQAAPASYATGIFGLDSDANMQALYDLVVSMRTALVAVGIMKGSA